MLEKALMIWEKVKIKRQLKHSQKSMILFTKVKVNCIEMIKAVIYLSMTMALILLQISQLSRSLKQ